ncbi:MAG: glycoside hydrolase family 65 protein [Candidatus Omnitrophica bacterium]|nr:glycoside hydrolase family 65 protein [Candidatus Omnitrophota bacterium]
MIERYADWLEDDLWLIKQAQYEKELQNIRESQFALGNGYIGTRAVLEEIPHGAMPGTYLSGVYDRMTSQVAELVNLPNPFHFSVTVNGEKVDVSTMDVLNHRRILNMRRAVLVRHTQYQDSKRRAHDYQSLRFLSLDNRNVGVMQVQFTPCAAACSIDINTGIDTSVYNTGTLTEGNKKHFRIKELGQFEHAGYLVVETFEKRHIILYRSGFYYELGKKRIFAKDNIFTLRLKRGEAVTFTKIFYITHFNSEREFSRHKTKALKKFKKIFHTPFDTLLRRHTQAWRRVWDKADVVIEGTANIQTNLRFNLYHLLICAHHDTGFSSIGARTLSGEGYRGHIFWDGEIFVFPFYLFTLPEVAKNMLLYRYQRLDEARRIATERGYEGAMFPWESAGTGEEETPTWAKDLDGSIVKIHTHTFEHHITADIAYAVYQYFLITGDLQFMKECGYEMLFESARFWASRVAYNRRRDVYEIRNVIGPDEFHVNVNNNAFTNIMARWNMLIAAQECSRLKKTCPRQYYILKKKIGLQLKETKDWRQKALKMHLIHKRRSGVIEQFDGFFKLRDVTLTEVDENGIPFFPSHLKTKDVNKTQLIKQADTVMLFYLFPELFSRLMQKNNYDFYIRRTVHKSSLSAPLNAVVACTCGDLPRAYSLFNVALRADISNLYGNTKEGMHAASLGGTWLAVLFGFAGVRVIKGRLCIHPQIPRSWRRVIFSLNWRGNVLRVALTNDTARIAIVHKKEKQVVISLFGRLYSFTTEGREYVCTKRPVSRRHPFQAR